MSRRLERALYRIDALERTTQSSAPLRRIDARAKLLLTVVYLVAMLSLPLGHLAQLMLFFLFPIAAATAGGLNYGQLFRRSLAVLPFVLLIGLFDLLFDREAAFRIGTFAVTRGAVRFLAIGLRGLLSVQAVLALILATGFYDLCRGLQRMGVPSLLTVQLLFVYRYMAVLIEESLALVRARDARSFGRGSYPLRLWGPMVGQLLLRTLDRAERIHRAMLARGFTGRIPDGLVPWRRWQRRDTLFLLFGSAAVVLLRWIDPTALIESFRT